MIDVPSINNGHYNKSGYTWNDFLSEFKLNFIELAFHCTKSGKKKYYIRVGDFSGNHFTISDQLKADRGKIHPRLAFGCHSQQKQFIASLARLDIDFSLPTPLSFTTARTKQSTSSNNEEFSSKNMYGRPNASSAYKETTYDANFNIIVQHFFDQVTIQGKDSTAILKNVDMEKMKLCIKDFARSILNLEAIERSKRLQANGIEEEMILLNDDVNENDFPALKQFGIPLSIQCIDSVLRDIVKLSK